MHKLCAASLLLVIQCQLICAFRTFHAEREPKYDEAVAFRYLQYARVGFCTEQSIVDWDCGDMCDDTEIVPGTVKLIGPGEDSGVLGYVAQLPKHASSDCILSFRGSVNLKNWRSDATAIRVEWPPALSTRALVRNEDGWCPSCLVHRGFALAYEELRDEMLSNIKSLGCRSIDIAGHSLGAAVATLAAIDLRGESLLVKVNNVWTYGSPRVGNSAFAEAFNKVAEKQGAEVPQWRVVHYHDPVPLVAPTWFYKHTPQQVYYSDRESSQYEVCQWQKQNYVENTTCGVMSLTHQDLVDGLLNNDHVNYMGKTFALKKMNAKCVPKNAEQLSEPQKEEIEEESWIRFNRQFGSDSFVDPF